MKSVGYLLILVGASTLFEFKYKFPFGAALSMLVTSKIIDVTLARKVTGIP